MKKYFLSYILTTIVFSVLSVVILVNSRQSLLKFSFLMIGISFLFYTIAYSLLLYFESKKKDTIITDWWEILEDAQINKKTIMLPNGLILSFKNWKISTINYYLDLEENKENKENKKH